MLNYGLCLCVCILCNLLSLGSVLASYIVVYSMTLKALFLRWSPLAMYATVFPSFEVYVQFALWAPWFPLGTSWGAAEALVACSLAG